MAERRYRLRASHVFFLPLLLFMFSYHDSPLASAAAAAATQEEIMRKVWSLLRSEQVDTGWNAPTPCQWRGINCSHGSGGSPRVVTGIDLSGHGISNSSIFGPLCSLTTLKKLDLSRNSFTDLKDQFFTSSSCPMKEGLQSLKLSGNKLGNSLGDLVGFNQLQEVYLSTQISLLLSDQCRGWGGDAVNLAMLDDIADDIAQVASLLIQASEAGQAPTTGTAGARVVPHVEISVTK